VVKASGFYPNKCPSYGSPNVARILYGMPSYEAFLDSKAGKIFLEGCVISVIDPKWGCTKCNAKIYKKMPVDL
jgi:hypothetical protein